VNLSLCAWTVTAKCTGFKSYSENKTINLGTYCRKMFSEAPILFFYLKKKTFTTDGVDDSFPKRRSTHSYLVCFSYLEVREIIDLHP
jgi:hypothetical protein